MKKVLFVIPNLTLGGTLSSFEGILKNVPNLVDFDIFVLSGEGNHQASFRDKMLPYDKWVYAYYCVYANASGVSKIGVFVGKLLLKLMALLGVNVRECISRRAVKKIECHSHYDIVVAFQEGFPTQFCSYFSNTRKIAWVHRDYSQQADVSMLKFYASYDNIVCVSKYTAETFKNCFPSLSDKVGYIYNFFNVEDILLKSGVPYEDNVIGKDNCFSIISIGRLHTVKRFSEIPRIAYKIKSLGAHFKWYIIGPDVGCGELSKLSQSIIDFKVSDTVIYLGEKPNPYPYLKASDLYVSLSVSEACPMVFNEAKLLGVPIVTTDFGAAYEFVEHNKNGLISSFEDLPNNIFRLISDSHFYAFLKNHITNQDFSNKNVTESILNLLVNENS